MTGNLTGNLSGNGNQPAALPGRENTLEALAVLVCLSVANLLLGGLALALAVYADLR